MKLKTRLIIAFCIIIFIPVFLAGIVFVGFRTYQMKDMEQNYGIVSKDYNYLMNSLQLLNRFTSKDFLSIKKTAENKPDKLQDVTYLNQINESLKDKNTYLIVRKEDQIIFQGGTTQPDVIEKLPDYVGAESSTNSGVYIDGDEQALLKQIDFTFKDGSKGSIFMIISAEQVVPEIKEILLDMIISTLLILIFTAAMLTIWIYRGIITPIKNLQTATQNIKEGNLEFTIAGSSKDEIGNLCDDFEQMRRRLKESQEEKIENEAENRVLISNISHDLKTPITSIKGYVEGIMDGVADTPEKMDRYIRTIYNKANEMNTLINELTLYSRIDANRIPYNFKKLRVWDYFNDCIEEIGLDLEAKEIGLTYYNYTDDDVMIIADPEQLTRVIHNIIGNSVKYMDKPKGFINIRIKDVGDFIQVEVEDNGKGIAAKDLPYIFDRFYRTDASRNSSTGGSGIGLSIVKKIIEDHGGKIWATSKEVTGTIMYFVIRKYQEVPNE